MRLEGIAKRYRQGGPWIVRDLTADVRPGQLVKVEGRNGSGKSTLLRVLAGVCEPSRGRVTGRPRTGYVPERFPSALPFTPRGYLTHLGRVHGVRGSELASRSDGWLDRLGLGGYSGTPLRRLSKGTCQKVAVAQALLGDPELLVLDEAWAGLDEPARAVLDDSVAERLTHGTAVVFVDHDPARLPGLAAAHWHIEDALVDMQPARGEPADPSGMVLIELTGSLPGGVDLRALPGVLAVGPPAAGGDPRAAGGDPPGGLADGGLAITTVRVAAWASDAVLRRLLTGGGAVHIHGVRPAAADPGAASAGAGAAAPGETEAAE